MRPWTRKSASIQPRTSLRKSDVKLVSDVTAHADGSDGEDWASLLRSFSVLRWERGWFKFAEDFVVRRLQNQLDSQRRSGVAALGPRAQLAYGADFFIESPGQFSLARLLSK